MTRTTPLLTPAQKRAKERAELDELTRRAFLWAEQDRQGLVECYPRNSTDPVVVQAREDARRLRAYRMRKWGKTRMEDDIANATHVVEVHPDGLRTVPIK